MWRYRDTCEIQNDERGISERILVILLIQKDPQAFEVLLLLYRCY